ncbi:VOC family protein [Tumebacillus flagellatus]|uniref:PhnB-like domain-containing protein n=1 Tax=Tumebacillus flagellatus TaxID=1157490 RepID=A0A074LXQ5_9BACL|nr:VOC family protein [Tumebacillus flagellatus]KEO84908.1 hypothetical protein EL26_02540 [Tumebacillus flagellatus]
MNVIPYLTFQGTTEEAMNFYAKALQGEIVQLDRYSGAPGMQIPEGWEDKVIHGRVKFGGDNFLYFSDADRDVVAGNSVSLAVEFDSEEAVNHAFNVLADGGSVFMPLGKTFWGALYGKLTDKFGINWDLNHTLKSE